MVATQGHHQIGRHMIGAHLRGAVLGGIAVGMQDPGGAHVGALTHVPVPGARAGHPHRVAQPTAPELVGEHLLRSRVGR